MNESRIREVLKALAVPGSHLSYKSGKWLILQCPFAKSKHKEGVDRNPSFGISIVQGGISYYNCFTCKQKGVFYNLPNHMARINEGLTGGDPAGVEYIKSLEADIRLEYSGVRKKIIDEVYDKPEPLSKFVYDNMFEDVTDFPEAVRYLTERGITQDAVNIIGIKFDPWEDRIVFPVYGSDNELYGFTGRTIDPNWKERHNPPHVIYPRIKDYYGFQKRHFMLGEHAIDPDKPTLIIEGLFGYASLISKGVLDLMNVVALLGSVVTPEKAKTLINSKTSLYLMLDNDPAGDLGIFGEVYPSGEVRTKGAIHYLKGYCRLYIPKWPDTLQDPDQLSTTHLANILEITYPY